MNYVDVFNHLQPVAQIARGCPTPTLRQAYVDAMRQWCSETQWLRIAIAGATTADTAQYSLGSDTYVEILAVAAMSGTHDSQQWPLVKGDPSGWNANAGTDRPRFYTYVPEGQFALFPTPDDTYNLTVTAIVQPKAGVTQVPSTPLVKYARVFEAGALAYLLAMKDTGWHNPREADTQMRVFKSGISNGKAEVQRNFNTGTQLAKRRRFIV